MHCYRTPVTLIIDDHVRDNHIDFKVIASLRSFGLIFEEGDIKHEIGVIEAVCPDEKLHDLKHIDGVSYVREQAHYLANDE
jgi:hypothetical protein